MSTYMVDSAQVAASATQITATAGQIRSEVQAMMAQLVALG